MDLTNTQILFDSWENVITQIPDKSIDAVITDPPYKWKRGKFDGSGFRKIRPELTRKLNTYSGNFNPFPYLEECRRVLKKFNGFFFTNYNLELEYKQWAKDNGYSYQTIVWEKRNAMPLTNGWFMPDVELAIYIREKGSYWNFDLPTEKYKTVRHDLVQKCIANNFLRRSVHPNEKPLSLIIDFIKLITRPGDIVFDGFSGSGTTPIACEQLQRICIATENDIQYYQPSVDDLNKVRGIYKNKNELFNQAI